MRKVIILITLLFTTFNLVACGKKQVEIKNAVVVVGYNYTGETERVLQEIVETFNQENSGTITVELKPITKQNFSHDINSDDYDVIIDNDSRINEYLNNDLLVDYKDYLSKDYSSKIAKGIYNHINSYEVNGMYFMPISTTGLVFFYNKDLYEKYRLYSPKDWGQLVINCKVLWENEHITGFGTDSLSDLMYCLIEQNKLTYINRKKGIVGFNNKKMVSIIEWYTTAITDGYFQLSAQNDGYSSTDFNEGKLASFIGNSASAAQITIENYGCGVIPATNDKQVSTVYSDGAMILHSDVNTEAASVKFVEYLVEEHNNTKMVISLNTVSPFLTTQDNKEYLTFISKNPTLEVLQQELTYSQSLPNITGSETVKDELEDVIRNVINGNDISSALSRAEINCNRVLK